MDRSETIVDNAADTVDDAMKSVKQVARAADGGIRTATESVRGGAKRLTKTARHAAARTDRLVQSNYWSAIGIAAAAGATIAVLLSLRMHR